MNKKGQLVALMVTITVVVIIGMVVLQVIFSQVDEQTTQTAITDDQFTSTNTTCIRVTSNVNCFEANSGAVINSSSGLVSTGNYTECGDGTGIFGFSLNPTGSVAALDGATMNSSYTQQSCNFIESGLTRTVMFNYSILFAIAILVFIAGFIILK